jgi:hypothetical protein
MSHCPNCQRHTFDPARPCTRCGARRALVAVRADGSRRVTELAPPTRSWTGAELALLVVLALLLSTLSLGLW